MFSSDVQDNAWKHLIDVVVEHPEVWAEPSDDGKLVEELAAWLNEDEVRVVSLLFYNPQLMAQGSPYLALFNTRKRGYDRTPNTVLAQYAVELAKEAVRDSLPIY